MFAEEIYVLLKFIYFTHLQVYFLSLSDSLQVKFNFLSQFHVVSFVLKVMEEAGYLLLKALIESKTTKSFNKFPLEQNVFLATVLSLAEFTASIVVQPSQKEQSQLHQHELNVAAIKIRMNKKIILKNFIIKFLFFVKMICFSTPSNKS